MFCLACWANVPDSATVCSKCGRPLSGRAGTAAAAAGGRSPDAPSRAPAPSAASPRLPVVLQPARNPESGAAAPFRLRVLGLGLALGLLVGGLLVLLGRREGTGPGASGRPSALGSTAAAEWSLAAIDLPPRAAPADLVVPLPAGEETRGLLVAARAAYEARDYEGAVASLRGALAEAPEESRERVGQALGAALEALGGQALARGDGDAALAALTEAVAVNPAAGSAWKALGAAQLRGADVPAAARSLETAARLLPSDPRAHHLLAIALYQEGRSPAALEHLRLAATHAPGDAEIAALLSKVEAEHAVEGGFESAATAHFQVTFEGGGRSEQAGYLVGLLLEDAYHAVGAQLDHYPVRPVHAVLYPAEGFRDVTQSPAWAGALYDGKIRLPVGGLTDRTPALARVLAHEYTHALVHELARGRAPVWLNEGLAQLSEGPDDGLLDQFRAYLRQGGRAPSLRALEGSFVGLSSAQAELAYATSLAATDYLVKSYGHAAARRILDRLGAGEPLAAAIAGSVYMSYEAFDAAWVASLSP